MAKLDGKECHCGAMSDCLSDLSYGEPPVASLSGLSFHGGMSPIPIPVPVLPTSLPALDFPLPSSEVSSSDKENSSPRSLQSAQQVVTELVEIQEVDNEEAQMLLDMMDAEVRSQKN